MCRVNSDRFGPFRVRQESAFITYALRRSLASEHIVRVVSHYENLRMAFEPKYLRIEPGDVVTWINEVDEEHNVITFPDGYPRGATAFQSPIMTRAGERFSHQFEVPGTYEYHCIPHLPMGMHGLIIVGRASRNDEFHKPSEAEMKAYRNLMLEWLGDDVEVPKREERASSLGLDSAGEPVKHEANWHQFVE